MNIFHKVALQGLRKNRTRTFVTIVGVAMSAAMFTAVTTFAVSLQSYMMNGAIEKYGGWHVAFPEVGSGAAEALIEDDRVESTAFFENIGYAVLEGGQNPDKPYLFLAGFGEDTFDTLPVEVISGRLPENGNEILVPAHVASNGGVRFSVGDTISLTVGMRLSGDETLTQHQPFLSGDNPEMAEELFVPVAKRKFTVVGICERPGFEEHTAPGYTLITRTDSAEHAGGLTAFVTLKNPFSIRSYVNSLEEGTMYLLNDEVLRFIGISGNQVFNMILLSIGLVLMALIMLGSFFLIYNSFAISLNERVRQFGILLSVGATQRQLRNSVLFEGFCIGLLGIPVGTAAGIPLIGLVLMLVSENFGNVMYDNVPLVLKVSVSAIVTAAVTDMCTILLSAYLPARKAAEMPVMVCIRQTNAAKIDGGAMRTPGPVRRLYGLEGTLAWKNFRRSGKRYRSIVLSLMLSVVLCVSADSFGTDLRQLGAQAVVDVDGDILFQTKNMEEAELSQLYDDLKTVSGVSKSTCNFTAGEPGGTEREALMTFWSDKPGQTLDKMRVLIEGAGITGAYTLRNVHEALEQNRNMLFIINLFAVFFIIMISLIAMVNVFNTISTGIRLRRRELAMLRSVGMSDREFGRMMRFECLLCGFRTLLFGLPAAGLCSWAIYMVLIGIEDKADVRFTFPWGSMAVSVLGVFAMIFVSMLYTTGKIKKENIIDALRDDLT